MSGKLTEPELDAAIAASFPPARWREAQPLRLVPTRPAPAAADTAPCEVEPAEFARLVQHLERGELAACTADACGQDHRRCPCPEACRLSVDSMRAYVRHRVMLAAAVALAALCAALAAIASIP